MDREIDLITDMMAVAEVICTKIAQNLYLTYGRFVLKELRIKRDKEKRSKT
jgi:hypothetical protein